MAAAQEKCDVVDSWEEIDDSEIIEKTFPRKTPSTMKTSNGPIIIQGDNSIPAQYATPEPSVKILKRPNQVNKYECTHNNNLGVNEDSKLRQPVRTLQQRQLDYAEARLRILGEARSPEEELDERFRNVNLNSTSVMLLRPCDVVTIVRCPRGPDGTTGFNLKR